MCCGPAQFIFPMLSAASQNLQGVFKKQESVTYNKDKNQSTETDTGTTETTELVDKNCKWCLLLHGSLYVQESRGKTKHFRRVLETQRDPNWTSDPNISVSGGKPHWAGLTAKENMGDLDGRLCLAFC